MRVDWKLLARRARMPAAGAAMATLLFGAYWLGGVAPAGSAEQTSAPVAETPPPAPEPLDVPSTAVGAQSSGMGGETWMSGDPAQLGAEFKRSVTRQFGDGTLGQAHMAMAGLGFECSVGAGGRMQCEKTIQADNCTLTWSVRMQSRGGALGGAGGEGFSRECS